jgi:hypothetical protein
MMQQARAQLVGGCLAPSSRMASPVRIAATIAQDSPKDTCGNILKFRLRPFLAHGPQPKLCSRQARQGSSTAGVPQQPALRR